MDLYFLALLLPEPLKTTIQEWKEVMKARYKTSHSLNAPPHITLLNPFRLKKEDKPVLMDLLNAFAKEHAPLKIKLKDFSHFGKGVLFVGVQPEENLMRLQEKVEMLARKKEELFRYKYKKRPFHPHITLAFKDLPETDFDKAWATLKDKKFEAEFNAEAVYLLKHDGKKWQGEEKFSLTRIIHHN